MADGLVLPGLMRVADDTERLFYDLGSHMADAAMKAVRDRGVFHVALSGGSTPEPFYMRLVTDPAFRGFPWAQTHIWIVDERRVPEDHEKSNIRMIRESLVDHVPIKSRQVHAMPVMEDDPAGLYEAALREHVGVGAKPQAAGNAGENEGGKTAENAGGNVGGVVDFILLGMGDDAHTASLFPGSGAIDVLDRWVVVNEGANVTPPDRVTMTYPLINAARDVVVLCVGAKKHATLQRVSDAVADGSATNDTLPITGIKPRGGVLAWYLDREAAGTGGGGNF